MRIDLTAAPHRVNDLLRYLSQMGYDAHEVEYGVVEVDPTTLPESHFGVGIITLSLRVRVWNAVNDAEARLVKGGGSLEP